MVYSDDIYGQSIVKGVQGKNNGAKQQLDHAVFTKRVIVEKSGEIVVTLIKLTPFK
jgi:hypothetical protein